MALDLVKESFGDSLYNKALDCVKALREEAIKVRHWVSEWWSVCVCVFVCVRMRVWCECVCVCLFCVFLRKDTHVNEMKAVFVCW